MSNPTLVLFLFTAAALAVKFAINITHTRKVWELLSAGVAVFCSFYVILSGLLFWGDIFSFERVLIAQTVLEAILVLAFEPTKDGRDDKFSFDNLKWEALPLIIVLTGMIFTANKFEFYDCGQDQGNYQAEAIALMNGYCRVQHDFPEYRQLSSKVQTDAYTKMTEKWNGFYRLRLVAGKYPTATESHVKSPVSGVFHGIATWPALMALSGLLFGLSNLALVQTFAAIGAALLIYYSLEHMGMKKGVSLACALIFMLSPIVVWTTKSSLSEIILVLFLAFYIYVISSTKTNKLWLALPLAAFAFFHVSFMSLVPGFFIIHVAGYALSKNDDYLYVNVFMALAMYLGSLMMANTAVQYFFDNLRRIYVGNIITYNNIITVIFIASLAIIGLSLVAANGKLSCNLTKFIRWKNLPWLISSVAVGSLAYMVFYGYKIAFLLKPTDGCKAFLCSYYGTGLEAYGHLNIYAFMMSTGYLILPIAIFYVIKKRWWLQNETSELCEPCATVSGNQGEAQATTSENAPFLLSLLFLYMVIIRSIFLNKDINYYYYYCRYLVPFVPTIAVVGGIVLNNFRKWAVNAVVFVSMGSMLFFNYPFLFDKDDTVCEWRILSELKNHVASRSAIILENSEVIQLGLDLKFLAHADIYPVFPDLSGELRELSDRYKHVYFLSNDELTDMGNNSVLNCDIGEFDSVYKSSYCVSHATDGPTFTVFPRTFSKKRRQVALYRYNLVKGLRIAVEDFTIGPAGRAMAGVIESNGQRGTVAYGPYMFLCAGRYELTIPVELVEGKFSSLSYRIYGNQPKRREYAKGFFNQVLKRDSGKCEVVIPFTLDKDAENVEFLISNRRRGTVVRLNDYLLKFL